MQPYDPTQSTFGAMLGRFYRSARVEVDPDLWMSGRMGGYRGGPMVDDHRLLGRHPMYGVARGGFHDATWAYAAAAGEGGKPPSFWADGAGRHEGALVAAVPGLLYVAEGFDDAEAIDAVIGRHLAEARTIQGFGFLGTATVGPDEVDRLLSYHRCRVARRIAGWEPGGVPDEVRREHESMSELDAIAGYPREEGWAP